MRKCNRCGALMNDYDRFCNQCGTKYEEKTEEVTQQSNFAEPIMDEPAPAEPVQPKPRYGHKLISSWDGTVFGTFLNSLAATLLITITLGIGTPWAVCYVMRYVIGHASIEGKRLIFDGKGGQLLGRWLLWMLLMVVTLGIYSFWVAPRMYKWVTSHIRFAE